MAKAQIKYAILTRFVMPVIVMLIVDASGYFIGRAFQSATLKIAGSLIQFPGAICFGFIYSCMTRSFNAKSHELWWWIESAFFLAILNVAFYFVHFPILDIRRLIGAP